MIRPDAASPGAELEISFGAEGAPRSRVIRIVANQVIKLSSLEYMMSNEACIASEVISMEGETLEVPLNHDLLTKLWNTPRTDMNHRDHSGPAKIAITASAKGKTRQYIVPVHMGNVAEGRKITGSKAFHGGPSERLAMPVSPCGLTFTMCLLQHCSATSAPSASSACRCRSGSWDPARRTWCSSGLPGPSCPPSCRLRRGCRRGWMTSGTPPR